MKPNRNVISFLCLLLLSISSYSQETYSKVKIHAPSDKYQFSHLMGLIEEDHFLPGNDGTIITELSQDKINKLKFAGYPYQVLIKDVARHLDSVNKLYYEAAKDPQKRVAFEQSGSTLDAIIVKPSAFEVKPTFGGYYSLAEMEAAMDALVATYPGIASKTSIGTTANGNNIWVIKISDNVASDDAGEPELLYMGLQHAREAITGASMIFFMQYLCERYALDSRIKDLVDNREIYIIPCFNPDGWEYNRTSQGGNAGGMWRKNRRFTGTYYGIDLNRNWGVDWAHCSSPILGTASSCGSSSPSSDTYWGTSAFSEAETQAVRAFTKSKNIVVGFDQHAFGPYYSLPFGRKSLHPTDMPEKGAQFYTAIPAAMGKYNGMRAADSYDALGYEVAGGFKDWMLMGELGVDNKDTVWAMTGEGGAGGGTSSNFWAPASQIVNLCKGMAYQNLQLAYAAGTYVDIQDAGSMAITATTGNLQFKIKRLGVGNEPVTVSLVPLNNMQSAGDPVTVNSMVYYSDYTGSISYTLPAINNGTQIRFIWKVETAGYSYADTITKFFNPTILLSDNMEGSLSTNWIVPNGGSADNKWSFTTLSAYSGTQSMTESPAGDYPANITRTVTYRNSLNLSDATSAYLSFWVKHRAENHRDRLQVQFSTDGSTWTALAGKTTIQEPGTLDGAQINGQPSLTGIQDYWIKENYNLSSYNGQPNVQFRFVFIADNSSSTFRYNEDDGFYIDDVIVFKTTGAIVALPVRNITLSAKMQPDKTVKLNWDATVDNMHNNFELQRSANGVDFQTIYNTSALPPCQYIDASPMSGNNYYRVRQIDKDGRITNSKTVIVNNKTKMNLRLSPNPASENLQVQLMHDEAIEGKVTITDMQGRELYTRKVSAAEPEIELNINIASWQPQLYVVTLTDNAGKVVIMKKIIKF